MRKTIVGFRDALQNHHTFDTIRIAREALADPQDYPFSF